MKTWKKGMRLLLPLLVAVATAAFFLFAREWIPRLAIFTGLALGVLTYIALQTAERLAYLYRKR